MNIQLSDRWRNWLTEVGIEIEGNMINLCGKKKLPLLFVKEVHEDVESNEAFKLFLFAAYDERGALMFELNANDKWSNDFEIELLNDFQDCNFLFGSKTVKNMIDLIKSKDWVPAIEADRQAHHEDLRELFLGWGWGQEYWKYVENNPSIDNADVKMGEDWETWIIKVLNSAKEFFDKNSQEAWSALMKGESNNE